jgi:lipoyl(octanoyl) transferase
VTLVAERTIVRALGRVGYRQAESAMREFTRRRGPQTPDELWVLEHPPVYTLGAGASEAHGPRAANGIPVLRCERGGEITYHGPGQAVLYTLVDLARRAIGVRAFVRLLEESVIALIGCGERREDAPGVYVGGAKIAFLGLRVTRGCVWHGLALNVEVDLEPFSAIDPCGEAGLAVTRTRDLGIPGTAEALGLALAEAVAARLDRA